MLHCWLGIKSYADIYKVCTGYTINKDNSGLPTKICVECEKTLILIHQFRLQIDNIEERLRNYQSEFEPNADSIDGYIVEQIYEDEPLSGELDAEFFVTDENLEYCEQSQESHDPIKPECRFEQSSEHNKLVKCRTCTDKCQLENLINNKRIDSNISIPCDCGNVFKNRRSFLKHVATVHHKKESNFKCRSCPETFTSWRSRTAHEANVHSIGLKFECCNCQKKFYRSDHFKDHEKSCIKHGDISEKFFACAICLFTFQREETYKKHLETAHVGADEGETEFKKRAEDYARRYSSTKTLEAAAETVEKESDCAICKICKKIFKNELSLNKHTSIFHTNQVFPCDKCDAVFVHRSTRISHMSKMHGLKKPFECTAADCSFSCFKKDRFNAHMDKHEDPDKKFSCPICQQEFKSYNTMTLHRAKHLTKNAFACPTCHKSFLDKRNYNIHVKLHTGEDLYHCPVCQRGFNRRDHLLKHQKRKDHQV